MRRQSVFQQLLGCITWAAITCLFVSAPFAQAPVPNAHHVLATTYYHTFSRAHPVLERVRPGDTVITKTLDTGGYDDKSVRRSEPFNPLTGPFFVEGAEPGDTLIIHFLKVKMNRRSGFTTYRLGLFSLTPESIEGLYPAHYKKDLVLPEDSSLVPWELDLDRQTVKLKEPVSDVIKLEFPAKPMLGCVGVAPAGEFAPTSEPSGSYGGNLDYNEIGEDAVVMLPVYHPGALLFIGDGHALQADGEPTGTGIETSMDVEFKVDVRKKQNLSGPRVETKEYIITLGSQPEFVSSLDRALQLATSDMVDWLIKDYKLEPWAAHLLIGYQGKYDVVTAAGSMALKIPKRYLPAKRN
jgi:amidase